MILALKEYDYCNPSGGGRKLLHISSYAKRNETSKIKDNAMSGTNKEVIHHKRANGSCQSLAGGCYRQILKEQENNLVHQLLQESNKQALMSSLKFTNG